MTFTDPKQIYVLADSVVAKDGEDHAVLAAKNWATHVASAVACPASRLRVRAKEIHSVDCDLTALETAEGMRDTQDCTHRTTFSWLL